MMGQERELLEALNSSRILTSMITPAVLISACGTLIFSTSARLGRIFDRVNVMKGEVESIITGNISYTKERMKHLHGQIELQRRRAMLIQKAMVSLYTATLLFVTSSLAIAVNVAYGSAELSRRVAGNGRQHLLVAGETFSIAEHQTIAKPEPGVPAKYLAVADP